MLRAEFRRADLWANLSRVQVEFFQVVRAGYGLPHFFWFPGILENCHFCKSFAGATFLPSVLTPEHENGTRFPAYKNNPFCAI